MPEWDAVLQEVVHPAYFVPWNLVQALILGNLTLYLVLPLALALILAPSPYLALLLALALALILAPTRFLALALILAPSPDPSSDSRT